MTADYARTLAARYFADHSERLCRDSGMPDDAVEHLRNTYIRDAAANPEAVRQLRDMYGHDIAAGCDQCGNTTAEDLRWPGAGIALCRDMRACQGRAARREAGR